MTIILILFQDLFPILAQVFNPNYETLETNVDVTVIPIYQKLNIKNKFDLYPTNSNRCRKNKNLDT